MTQPSVPLRLPAPCPESGCGVLLQPSLMGPDTSGVAPHYATCHPGEIPPLTVLGDGYELVSD